MALRKSKTDILKNEKYMDDAVYSAFMNLHKAAKRKGDYIWSTERFNSLDSIWGDPIESESSKILDVTTDVETADHEQKTFKRKYVNTEPKTGQLNRSCQVDVELRPGDPRKTGLFREQNRNTFTREKSPLLKNFEKDKINDCSESNLEFSKQQNKAGAFAAETPKLEHFDKLINTYKQGGNRVKQEFRKSNPDVNLNYERCPEKFEEKQRSQLKKTIEKARGKRHYLSSSVNGLSNQKYLPIENHDTAYSSGNERNMLRTMLVLKIFKGEKMFDYTLDLPDLKRMKKRFPKLVEIFPEIDGAEKELCYSTDAVKIVIGFLRNLRYDAPDERTAVEVIAASKSWGINQFHAEFQQKFLKNLSKNNIHLAYKAAVHYGLEEICDAYKCAFGDDLLSDIRPYRQRKCYVSLSTYIEPREFCFPSMTTTSTLHDNFNRDIQNEISFEAMSGSYVITGFRILLNLDIEKDNDTAHLDFYYTVTNTQNSYQEELKVRKPLRSKIAINLQKNLTINENQTAKIFVETSIKPYLCPAVKEDSILGRCDEKEFCIKMTSTYKVANSSEKRFFIGKLLYYPKT